MPHPRIELSLSARVEKIPIPVRDDLEKLIFSPEAIWKQQRILFKLMRSISAASRKSKVSLV